MSKIFKLKDLQNSIDIKSAPPEILNIQPLESNYLVENSIISKKIVEVNKFYKPSTLPLVDHLRLRGTTDSCYVKISDSDVAIIDEKYK